METETPKEHIAFVWSLDEVLNVQHTFPVIYSIDKSGITHIKLFAFIKNKEDNDAFTKISSKQKDSITLLGYDGKFVIFRKCKQTSEKSTNLYYEIHLNCFEIYRGLEVTSDDSENTEIKDNDINFKEVHVSFSGFQKWFSNWFLPKWKEISNEVIIHGIQKAIEGKEEIKLAEYEGKEIGIFISPYKSANYTEHSMGYKPWIYVRSNSNSLPFSGFETIISGLRRFLTLLTGNPSHIENINAFPENYMETGHFVEIRYAEEGYYGTTQVYFRGISYKDIEQNIDKILNKWLSLFFSTNFTSQFQVLLFVVLYFDLQINIIVPQKTFTTLAEALEIYCKGRIKNSDRLYIKKALFNEMIIKPCKKFLLNIDLLKIKENKNLLKRITNILIGTNEKRTSEIVFEVLNYISEVYGIKKEDRLDIGIITRITNLRNNIIHSPHNLDSKDFNLAYALSWRISDLLRALIFYEIGIPDDRVKLEIEGAFHAIKNILEK